MSIAEAALRSLVGLRSPAPVTAAPVLNGSEVFATHRVPVTDWVADGPAVAGSVVFGPFAIPVSFDTIRLYHGGEELVDLPRRSVMNLDPGDRFEEPVFLDGTDG